MSKVTTWINNTFCPQPLFLFGTYDKNDRPNFGLFGWMSYFRDSDLHITASIAGRKLTRERLRTNKQYSVNLVSRSMLTKADYYGYTSGYDPSKMSVTIETVPGEVLHVPLIVESPWSFEVEVETVLPYDDCDLFICKVHNVMAFEELADEELSMEERMRLADPVVTVGSYYFALDHTPIAPWGDPKLEIKSEPK